MKKKIARDKIFAVLNCKEFNDDNCNYIHNIVKNIDKEGDTYILTEDNCYRVKASSKYIAKKLNKALFLRLGGN